MQEELGEGDKALKTAFEAVDNMEFDRASEAFEEAIRLGCQYMPLALNYSGTFAFIRGDADLALAAFNKSLDLDPNQAQVWAKRASVHMEKCKHPRSHSLRFCLCFSCVFFFAFLFLLRLFGVVGADRGQADRSAAMADFAKAIEVDPADPDVYYHRGQVRFLMGDFSDAAADYTKSAELDKKFVYSQVQLGVAQYKMGQINDSLVTFRKVLKQFKNSAEAYNYYGEILLDQGNFPEALEKFDTAIDLERTGGQGKKVRNIMPLVNRAVLYLQWKKDAKEAERNLRSALECNPPFPVLRPSLYGSRAWLRLTIVGSGS